MKIDTTTAIGGLILAYFILRSKQAAAEELPTQPGSYLNTTNLPIVQKEIVIPIPEQKQVQPQEQYFYAEYEIPLYSIINRTITSEIYDRFTSFGGTIQNLKNIDLSNIPLSTWTNIGFNLAFSAVCNAFGPAGWVMSLVTAYLQWASRPEKPEKIAGKAIEEIKQFPLKYNISPKDGMLLGILAKNRVNSSMVPLVRVENKGINDQTYVTTELLPIFTESGYINTGSVLGYISKLPFENSCVLKMMYHILLADFVLVIEGSEYERILVAYNYLPITTLGYISTKIQKGQEGIFIPDIDQIEQIKSLTKAGIEFLFQYQKASSSDTRFLSTNVKLDPKGSSLFEKIQFPTYYPIGIDIGVDNAYYTEYIPKGLKNKQVIDMNTDYYDKGRLPSSDIIANLYEPVNVIHGFGIYVGLDIPPLGGMTTIITEDKGSMYDYLNRRVFIPKNTDRVLVHQIDGSLLEIILGNTMNDFQKFSIFNTLKYIASDQNPRITARVFLGPYLQIDNGRPVYVVDDDKYINEVKIKYEENKDSWYKYVLQSVSA